MSDRRTAWPYLVAGLLLASIAAAFAFIHGGWLLPPEVLEGRRWYLVVMGAALAVMAAAQFFVGIGRAIYGRPLDSDLELLANLWMAAAILGMLAVMATYAALAAWIPELPATFEGGITGTLTEHRIVWPIVALVVDVIALPFVVLVPLGTIGWIVRALRRRAKA